MEKVYLKNNPNIKDDISNIYLSAFPSNERPPLEWFYAAVNRYEENQVIGYYDNNEFIGFTYLVFYKDILYIAYFAVSEGKRNMGYGSKILEDIKNTYHRYVILLCFEEVDEKYSDYSNRLKRRDFYVRNGFVDNHMKTREGEVVYQSSYIGSHTVTFDDYKMIFDHTYGPGANEKYLKEVTN